MELGGDVGVGHRALSDSRNQVLSVQGISSNTLRYICIYETWLISNQTVLAWRAAGAVIAIPGNPDENVD